MRVARPGDLILAPSGDLEACLRYYHPELGVATLESLARKSRSMSATLGKLEADAARVRAFGGRAWGLGTGLVVTREVSELWNQAPDGMAALRAWKGSLQVRAAYGDTTSTIGPEGPLGQPVMLEWFAETSSPR